MGSLSVPNRRLIKPLVAAVILVLIISGVVIFILPQYVYISPFSSFYASGFVDHKGVGYGTDSNGAQYTTYTVSVTLFNDDPVNHFSSGDTLGYIVSKADWDMVAWGDTVKIKLLPDAQAKVVELYPTLNSPEWELSYQSPVSITLTSDKPEYTLRENANFTVHLTNDPQLSGGIPFNVSLSLFKNCFFYIFLNGKMVTSNDNLLEYDNPLEIETVSLQPNQEINYQFNLSLTNIHPGTYYVRAYIGYLQMLEPTVTLTATVPIYVFE